MAQFLPATLIRKQSSGDDSGKWHIGKIDKQDQAFEIFTPTHFSQFRTVSFSGRLECQTKEGTRVLASFDDGQPLLLEINVGKGSSLLLLIRSFRLSEFPFNPLFVPFVQQMARSLVAYTDARKAYWVGDSPLRQFSTPAHEGNFTNSILTGSLTYN
jgi:hypothetical protein